MSGADPRVRRLTPDDWALYRDVRLAALRDAPYAFASTLEREASFDEWQWRERLSSATTFVVVDGGVPAATATALPAEAGDVHLVGMWVRADLRGTGVGQRLVSELVGWAREEDVAGVVLWVVSDNERARRFYAGVGFAATGVRQQMPEKPSVGEEQWRLAL